MKSLEHIIRDIREGKGEKGEKKSLEHSIRKVVTKEYESSYGAKDSKPVEEDVGGLVGSGTGGEPKLHAEDGKKKKEVKEAIGTIGTDKYQGNEFKSIRTATPHIKPPSGEESHSQAPENASRQRSIAKERAGINRVTEEEQIDEVFPALAAAAPYVMPAIAATGAGIAGYIATRGKGKLPSFRSYDPEAAKKNDSYSTAAERMKQMKSVSAPAIDKPIEVQTEPEKKKKEEKPAAPTAKPAEAPPKAAEKPAEVATPAKAEVGTKAEAPPKTAAPAIPAKPAATTPAATAPAAVTPKTAAPAVPATPAAVTPATKSATSVATGALSPRLPGISLGGSGTSQVAYDTLHRVPHDVKKGHARKHKTYYEDTTSREKIENMPRKGDRKSIEYVGRKDADPKTSKEKTSRLATIKNVIDEARKNLEVKKIRTEDGKTKVFDYGKDVLIINPDRQKQGLDFDGEKTPKDYDNK